MQKLLLCTIFCFAILCSNAANAIDGTWVDFRGKTKNQLLEMMNSERPAKSPLKWSDKLASETRIYVNNCKPNDFLPFYVGVTKKNPNQGFVAVWRRQGTNNIQQKFTKLAFVEVGCALLMCFDIQYIVCKYADKVEVKGTWIKFNTRTQKQLLKMMNSERPRGEGLTWDDELATEAKEYVQHCEPVANLPKSVAITKKNPNQGFVAVWRREGREEIQQKFTELIYKEVGCSLLSCFNVQYIVCKYAGDKSMPDESKPEEPKPEEPKPEEPKPEEPKPEEPKPDESEEVKHDEPETEKPEQKVMKGNWLILKGKGSQILLRNMNSEREEGPQLVWSKYLAEKATKYMVNCKPIENLPSNVGITKKNPSQSFTAVWRRQGTNWIRQKFTNPAYHEVGCALLSCLRDHYIVCRYD